MPAEQVIQRVENEDYLNTIVRAMTTADVRSTTPDALGRISDYHRIDYSNFLSVANTEHTPISATINRKEGARDIQHFWFEQYLPHGTQAAYDGSPWLDSPTPVAELDDPTETGLLTPVQFSNKMMKIGRVFQVSDIARAVFAAGGLLDAFDRDEVGRQWQYNATLLLRAQEVAILKSIQTSSGAPGMRGILGKYSTAAGTGTVDGGWYGLAAPDGSITAPVENRTSINLKGVNPKELVATTPAGGLGADQMLIETALNQALMTYYNLYAGPVPTDLYVAPRTINLLQTAARSKVQVFMTQQEFQNRTAMNLGGITGKYMSDFGEINFTAHPMLHSASASTGTAGKDSPLESRMVFLYMPGISLVDLVGFGGIHIEPRAKVYGTGGAADTRVMYEYITLEMRYLLSNGFITGYWHA